MDTGSFVVHVKTEDIYKDIAEDNKIRLDTANFKLDRLSSKGKKRGNWINEK